MVHLLSILVSLWWKPLFFLLCYEAQKKPHQFCLPTGETIKDISTVSQYPWRDILQFLCGILVVQTVMHDLVNDSWSTKPHTILILEPSCHEPDIWALFHLVQIMIFDLLSLSRSTSLRFHCRILKSKVLMVEWHVHPFLWSGTTMGIMASFLRRVASILPVTWVPSTVISRARRRHVVKKNSRVSDCKWQRLLKPQAQIQKESTIPQGITQQ